MRVTLNAKNEMANEVLGVNKESTQAPEPTDLVQVQLMNIHLEKSQGAIEGQQ